VLDLIAAAHGVGPGKSLEDKAKEIQAAIAGGQKTSACSQLRAM
jgi:hypothetical protein